MHFHRIYYQVSSGSGHPSLQALNDRATRFHCQSLSLALTAYKGHLPSLTELVTGQRWQQEPLLVRQDTLLHNQRCYRRPHRQL